MSNGRRFNDRVRIRTAPFQGTYDYTHTSEDGDLLFWFKDGDRNRDFHFSVEKEEPQYGGIRFHLTKEIGGASLHLNYFKKPRAASYMTATT